VHLPWICDAAACDDRKTLRRSCICYSGSYWASRFSGMINRLHSWRRCGLNPAFKTDSGSFGEWKKRNTSLVASSVSYKVQASIFHPKILHHILLIFFILLPLPFRCDLQLLPTNLHAPRTYLAFSSFHITALTICNSSFSPSVHPQPWIYTEDTQKLIFQSVFNNQASKPVRLIRLHLQIYV